MNKNTIILFFLLSFWAVIIYQFYLVYKKNISIFKNYEIAIAELYGWDIEYSSKGATQNIALIKFKDVKIRRWDNSYLNKYKLPVNAKFLVIHEKGNPENYNFNSEYYANTPEEIKKTNEMIQKEIAISQHGFWYYIFHKSSFYLIMTSITAVFFLVYKFFSNL